MKNSILKRVLISVSIMTAVLVSVVATTTSVSADNKYKVVKNYYFSPQQYHVKGEIYKKSFSGFVSHKYRQQATWFETQQKSLVRQPNGKKVVYYYIGTSIPQLDQNAGLTGYKPLRGWIKKGQPYHRRSQAQPKRDLAYLRELVNTMPQSTQKQILPIFSKIHLGTAYTGYTDSDMSGRMTPKNMKKLMAALNNEQIISDIENAIPDASIETDDEDFYPTWQAADLYKIYHHFRPRFKQEMKSLKGADRYASKLKEISTWSQSQYNHYQTRHNDANGDPWDLDQFSEDYLYGLLAGLGRSNMSYKASSPSAYAL
ncbi:hypothetical protein KOM07_04750 [Lentilactobacillus sp. G22-6]|uniref:hypothetical protein n=1 Tax=Lentilactobacillus dabitei TaxID=2831523 RepID=UPI001C266CAB|nr:hypothetical protein [Lentilactobacillus dabitei]MBU9788850.1 hypothetical protein [Lentilactobacillus dabitei]